MEQNTKFIRIDNSGDNELLEKRDKSKTVRHNSMEKLGSAMLSIKRRAPC